jgi:hypothetical protein
MSPPINRKNEPRSPINRDFYNGYEIKGRRNRQIAKKAIEQDQGPGVNAEIRDT